MVTQDRDINDLVVVKSMYDLKEYIYDFDQDRRPFDYPLNKRGKNRDLDAMKRFDALDCIIMDIDLIKEGSLASPLLPWMRQAHDLLLLFRMCKAAEKPLLAMGGGMGLLAYFCATTCTPY